MCNVSDIVFSVLYYYAATTVNTCESHVFFGNAKKVQTLGLCDAGKHFHSITSSMTQHRFDKLHKCVYMVNS